MKRMCVALGLLFTLALLSLPGLATAQGSAGAVSGTLAIRERVALPNNSVVTVQIAQLSSGSVSQVVAEQRFTTNGAQPPFRYTISYDPARIDQNAQYTIQANISVDGQVRFTTASIYRVITGGAPITNVNIVLVSSTSSRLPSTGGGVQPLLIAGLALVAALVLFAVRRLLVRG